MRRSGTRAAISRYVVPPDPPDGVIAALKSFDLVADRWGRLKGEIADAKAAQTDAEAKDIDAIASAARDGKDVKDPTAHRDAADAALSELQARLEGVDSAMDVAGNELALAIHQERAAWLTGLAATESAAADRYDAAMAEARAAFQTLRAARGGRVWVENFDHGRAVGGAEPQFSGGRINVRQDDPGPLKGEHNPDDLLALAALATAPFSTLKQKRQLETQREREAAHA